MKFAEINSEPTANSNGYVWRWRGSDGISSECFNFYYECMDDARRKGYDVRLEHARGDTSPTRDAGSGMK
ncbi:MAG: hypothetical protein JWN13_3100 [Betaproteobacteria bacterium]|jgi:hypothetical protein|nr:hypothetical protein [Betaproteobacteria bacterium]MEA3152826.1 hypothetical protein [Betaproteobacteria bacterium]HEV7391547.1 hypothetical protein [Burkholderiales bacterium]